jgi:hypothetical protein
MVANNNNGQETAAIAVASHTKKPLLVITAAPAAGHSSPLLHIAREMVNRGFEVIFMSSLEFKEPIERLGAEFYETNDFWPAGGLEVREQVPPGFPRMLWDMEHLFINNLPVRSGHVRSLLEMLHERDPSRDIVIINEAASMAIVPFVFGAPLPKGYTKFPKVIGIGAVPMVTTSIDTGPFGMGLPPDSTESGRMRNKLLNDFMRQGPFKGVDDLYQEVLKKCECTNVPEEFMFDTWISGYDATLQLCCPSLEYPKSDLHPTIRYAGCLPKRGIDPEFQFPTWWSEFKSNSELPVGSAERKKVVTVTQGTVQLVYDDLVIPTIKAFAKRSDVIVVVILGVKGASLPAEVEVPANVLVADFLPYDAALEHSDCFVTNAGYGGLLHCAINGVPLVMAGITEDKPEVSARGEYAGIGINLRTGTPTSDEVYNAVEKILTQPSYKAKATRIMLENEDLDTLSIIERQIMKFAKAT